MTEIDHLKKGRLPLSHFMCNFLKYYKIMFDQLKDLLEKQAFGVCSYLGHKMGVASHRVRIYFIYLSFAAMGSPIIFYLFVAFWLNVRAYIRKGKEAVWE